MQEPIYSFSAVNSSDQSTLMISLVVFVIAGIISYLFLKPVQAIKMDSTRRNTVAMLCFFAATIALSTAFFSYWNMRKSDGLALYADHLTVGANEIAYTQIRNAVIRTEKATAFLNPEVGTRNVNFLLIEEKTGKTHAVSSENYPVAEIMVKLKELMKPKN